jgi:small subunit ribosomal protein S14
MTTSNWKKAFKQLDAKPDVKKKYIKHNKPKKRAHGIATRTCRVTGSHKAHISKYGIHLCRHAFRENAQKLGFKKYR